jgi:GINS complex subunit 2
MILFYSFIVDERREYHGLVHPTDYLSSTPAMTTHIFPADLSRHANSSFVAGDESILVIPSFTFPKPLQLLSRESVGPFTAGISVTVPLWMALLFQERHLCTIVPPSWMTVESLKSILVDEQTLQTFSTKLPYYYLDIARALTTVQDKDSVLLLLNDISTVRMDKIRTNLHSLSEELASTTTLPMIDVTGISSLELAAIQPLVVQLFGDCLQLARKEQSAVATKPVDETVAAPDGNGASRLRRFR